MYKLLSVIMIIMIMIFIYNIYIYMYIHTCVYQCSKLQYRNKVIGRLAMRPFMQMHY